MVAMRALIVACASLAALAVVEPASAQDAESQVYASAKSCAALNSYLRAYPNGRFKSDAKARIGRECGSTPAKPAAADKPKTAPASGGDPCVQARADWAQIQGTQDISVLRVFLAGAPTACNIQRAQAQARADTLQSAATEQKRVEWKGVPEFDGVWVLDGDKGGCGNFPWRHQPSGQYIRRIYGNGDTREMKVLAATPPTLGVRENNKGRAVIEGQRMRIENKDGKLDCYLKRQ